MEEEEYVPKSELVNIAKDVRAKTTRHVMDKSLFFIKSRQQFLDVIDLLDQWNGQFQLLSTGDFLNKKDPMHGFVRHMGCIPFDHPKDHREEEYKSLEMLDDITGWNKEVTFILKPNLTIDHINREMLESKLEKDIYDSFNHCIYIYIYRTKW
jgi:hypothetical protein